jgi:hypothetical protein
METWPGLFFVRDRDAGALNFATAGPFPLRIRFQAIEPAAMTRTAIERCIWVFIVALILTFGWTLTKVAGLLGLF